jgi:hypothetical protein
MLMITRQFQKGARALRSEIVSVLKQNAVSIFEIDDIKIDEFLNKNSRSESRQLKALREGNAFLFASGSALPGNVEKIERYYRSQCIARVSIFFPQFRLGQRILIFLKALRVVLLGLRAIDGSNKRKRSQSRAAKFGVTELSNSMLAFIATVVCISRNLFEFKH